MKHLGEGGGLNHLNLYLKCFFCEKIIWGYVQMMFYYLSIYLNKYIYIYMYVFKK